MFAVIYRNFIKIGYESQYTKLWHKIACYFIEHRGAQGSCLHKREDGSWLAYSRWPDKATRDASWPGENTPSHELPDDIKAAIIEIKNCFHQERPSDEICMDVIDDLLLRNYSN